MGVFILYENVNWGQVSANLPPCLTIISFLPNQPTKDSCTLTSMSHSVNLYTLQHLIFEQGQKLENNCVEHGFFSSN
jgi:hypothetical protein